jgi:hypothetical protein
VALKAPAKIAVCWVPGAVMTDADSFCRGRKDPQRVRHGQQ